MNIRNKNILVGIIATIMLCAFIFVFMFVDSEGDEPQKENHNNAILYAEFPGGKYSTFFDNQYTVKYITIKIEDEYNPLYHFPYFLPYYMNSDTDGYHKVVFEGAEHKIKIKPKTVAYVEKNSLRPSGYFNFVDEQMSEKYSGLVRLDTGELRQLTFEEFNGPAQIELDDEAKIEIANKVASKYIDLSKCEITVDGKKVVYQQKYNDIYLNDPFNIFLGKNANNEVGVMYINFGTNGRFDEVEFSTQRIEEAIKAKISSLNKLSYCKFSEITEQKLDIAKFGVPVMISTVHVEVIEENTTQIRTMKFYTKLCD